MPSASSFAKPAGVPPAIPTPASPLSKEPQPMGRTPFPGSPQPPAPGGAPQGFSSGGGMPQGPGAPPRPGMQPAAAPRPAPTGERRTLVVGRGISVQGTVQDAERLVVEGTVEASMIRATELSIAQGGVFKGAVEVEEAEIAGTIDGTLTARSNLIVRATGKVLGTAHYRRLQVEDGGQITGELKMTAEGRNPEPAKTVEG
ncbi:MAG: polymer-forming cytoskeletal protein [Acetobacteraceae bacterium]|nr:polymer-forming cytoskeletal protein [Acetobacteraceae bacterium]